MNEYAIMIKVGDYVLIKEEWFLSPENRTGNEWQEEMRIIEIDEVCDAVELVNNSETRWLRMRFSGLIEKVSI